MRRSLNLRLLTFAGAAIAAALIAAWLTLGLLFERHAERQLRAELERHGLSLIAALSLDAGGRPVLAARPFDPRFERPAGGLYWRIQAPGGEIRSRSLWDGVLPAAPAPPAKGWGVARSTGPFEARVVAVVRDVRLDPGGPPVLVEVAADQAPLARARAAFGRESALFLTLLWLALAAAAWVQVRLGLRPLARVRTELEAMRRDPSARLADAGHPVEIRPLTQAINAFADSRAADVERARRRARDLAHALKTPLTALRLQIEALDPDTAREMAHGLALVSGAVEGELARAEGAGGGEGVGVGGEGVAVAGVVERLLAVIARTPDGATLQMRYAGPPELALPLTEAAALEALGAVLENAARHAATAVVVDGGAADGASWLTVDDDGPGIPADQREAVLGRGVRLDERGQRHGLGLAIARDFVEASGGRLELAAAPGGGLRVAMRWG